jgi:hypothetical protein
MFQWTKKIPSKMADVPSSPVSLLELVSGNLGIQPPQPLGQEKGKVILDGNKCSPTLNRGGSLIAAGIADKPPPCPFVLSSLMGTQKCAEILLGQEAPNHCVRIVSGFRALFDQEDEEEWAASTSRLQYKFKYLRNYFSDF